MDISDTIAPKSDQLDAVDLLSGPRTFTVTEVNVAGGDQPVNIRLAEFPRVWRPGLSMRRVLANVWGKQSAGYVGRRLTLYCDTSVKFGGVAVGGIRISHMSHIDEPKPTPLILAKGKGGSWTVQPLEETNADRIAALRAEWKTATPERQEAIKAEVKALEGDS